MTNIEWTDLVDNIFTVYGGGWWCRRISEGCDNCYAATLNKNSFFGGNHLEYSGDRPADLILRPEIIAGWKKMTKPKRHFVASMTDIFGEWVTELEAHTFLTGMWVAPKQTFQMLTKRPLVAGRFIKTWLELTGLKELPAHMWIGASVENQKWADIRIPQLLSIPAKVRFLSCEPLLGPIDLTDIVTGKPDQYGGEHHFNCLSLDGDNPEDDEEYKGALVAWVIVGGESGKGARPCNVSWIRSIVSQCKSADVKCFVKQLGANVVNTFIDTGETTNQIRTTHTKGGDPSEWAGDLRVREFPQL